MGTCVRLIGCNPKHSKLQREQDGPRSSRTEGSLEIEATKQLSLPWTVEHTATGVQKKIAVLQLGMRFHE